MINFWKKKKTPTSIDFLVNEKGDIDLNLYFTKDNIEELIHLIYFLSQPACIEYIIDVLKQNVGEQVTGLIIHSLNIYGKSLREETPIVHPGSVFSNELEQ